MARVTIKLPNEFLFATQMDVRVTDLNYGEHVGNDTVLSLVHESRMRFLQHYGFDEGDMMGVGLIMADAAVQYKREIRYGTTLEVLVAPCEYTRKGFELLHLLRDKDSLMEYARVKTGLVCFDYQTRTTQLLPKGIPELWTKLKY